MPLLDGHEEPQPANRRWLYWLIGVALAAGAAYMLAPGFLTPPEVSDGSVPVAPAPAAPAAPAEPEREVAETPAPDRAAAEPEAAPEPEPELSPPAPPPPPPIALRVTSDVDGADVFIDRLHVGTTPFESHDVEPGRHRINVTATGYESYAEDVEIGGDLTSVTASFREVRLDERIAVVHKHRFGNCAGELVASTSGIVYRTDDDDAFEAGLDALEEFEVDYLEHNLRIKIRGGRTYNFSDSRENADALFVFHREVEEAQERLARGDQPAANPAGNTGGGQP